ncbi:MAG: hypothetical protein ACD_83C00292G0002 [uncultured bacterium]|uniref:GxxExxY protein n=1 Tax=Candidatus Gottesmanbacteria bacterium GW2011_GWB1_43_11 TaxID=1618446 RepID=A0A0G1CJ13_9BACT|nr:MAG: hypothetical protein ACD_83C00292G0002 [uncultured bacterium]KKS39819.1 MAG: hypothetical protein UV04_C0036G0006 [Candidatus Gottesmanbacteria bacterium GW2011_GWA2_42_16]KKS53707.1 MAG: hypothetical protein UV17_C0032G0007 [Candidatus Gottesmanbacteria bacterium GW2011_GWA1_42_26]KKS81102.1 MAG: hypothetical protein UV55_C0021G0003 [Candidatus Gottesmanbacteria bacterium GW2011_GWC1_43_10]KKS85805.1 MAG: hypothetical protein UV61_C0015G0019 [Candidatus Gottesmanbacteria bacterium GW20
MPTNPVIKRDLIYPDLSYKIAGICFTVHNELGRFAREKQYGNALEKSLIQKQIQYKRELTIGDSRNISDFVIDDKILLELKAKPFILKDDYYQVQRYLYQLRLKLGILVNFRSYRVVPKRILLTEKTVLTMNSE